MAQRLKSDHRKKAKVVAESLPFTKMNYGILFTGIALIVLGYIALAQQPWDGFMALFVAPVLLVLGYCVVVPIGILFRPREDRSQIASPPPSEVVPH
jgi:hypothetical protein